MVHLCKDLWPQQLWPRPAGWRASRPHTRASSRSLEVWGQQAGRTLCWGAVMGRDPWVSSGSGAHGAPTPCHLGLDRTQGSQAQGRTPGLTNPVHGASQCAQPGRQAHLPAAGEPSLRSFCPVTQSSHAFSMTPGVKAGRDHPVLGHLSGPCREVQTVPGLIHPTVHSVPSSGV